MSKRSTCKVTFKRVAGGVMAAGEYAANGTYEGGKKAIPASITRQALRSRLPRRSGYDGACQAGAFAPICAVVPLCICFFNLAHGRISVGHGFVYFPRKGEIRYAFLKRIERAMARAHSLFRPSTGPHPVPQCDTQNRRIINHGKSRKFPIKFYLSEEEMPRYWYNVRADMQN